MRPVTLAASGRRLALSDTDLPIAIGAIVPGDGPWEVEIGFGKGRYLLARAARDSGARFLGIEMAAKYFRLVEKRADRRGLDNLLLVLGEAAYLMAAVLPRGFASAVHVYFPDPWPKDRHHKRRLFDPETIDLVLSLLCPEGLLYFATDHLEYGAAVAEILESHPALGVARIDAWPEGPRTNYEAKYEHEERPILRLQARLVRSQGSLVHPAALEPLTVAGRRERPEASGC